MMRKYILIGLLIVMSISGGLQLNAQQCKINNTAFQAGEELLFDLYFKWGPIYTKAGHSILSTANSTYGGKSAYKMTLHGETSGAVEKLFYLNDTLTSYMTKDLVPLAFYKNALEGSDYTKEVITYTYKGKITEIRTKRDKNGGFRFDETLTSNGCMYDMVSVVFYARTLNYSSMKKGDEVRIEFMSGRRKVHMEIEHQGFERIKANNGKKYNCIKLVLSIRDDAFESKEEAMKVYITKDGNHMPIRMESKLKIGSTRAILKSYKGNRHTVE